jgi:hypothetical protein
MRDRPGGLQEHHAVIGRSQVNAPGGMVVGEGPHIKDRVIATQREFETVLALGGAVASPGVATQPRQHRRDVMSEVDAECRVQSKHGDGHIDRLARQL